MVTSGACTLRPYLVNIKGAGSILRVQWGLINVCYPVGFGHA